MAAIDDILAECVRRPDDDELRLVWADAIGGERGELVALQCGRDAASPAELAARNRRERELLEEHGLRWSGLEGLARRVQFRRGFVDAIEVDADTWLADADRIIERAPLATGLSIIGIEPQRTLAEVEHLAVAGQRLIPGGDDPRTLERFREVVSHPAFAQFRALDVVDGPIGFGNETEWGDAIIGELVASGTADRLVALGLVTSPSPAGARALGPRLACLERLRVRRPAAAGTLVSLLLAPRLRALEIGRLVDPWPGPRASKLRELAIDIEDVAVVGTTPRLEALVIRADDRLRSPPSLAPIARLSRLRSLELRGLAIDRAIVRELARLELPGLRELRLSWTDDQEALIAIVRRFGGQLELLDLRDAPRLAPTDVRVAGDVVVDEPAIPALLDAYPPPRADWRSHAHTIGVTRRVWLESPAPPAWLVAETGGSTGRVWNLGRVESDEVRIGRSSYSEVCLADGSVARGHARIEWRADHHAVRDLGSTNGLYVEGKRVDGARLEDGARIQIGDVQLRYFVGRDGGARASACARAVATIDPMTRFSRETRPEAARIVLVDREQRISEVGSIEVELMIAELADRLRLAAPPGVVLTRPDEQTFGVYPATAAAALVAACDAPVDAGNGPMTFALALHLPTDT